MRTYLVQRAKKEDRDHKTGIDSIIKLDYMGSSEFEWGALPRSLKYIRTNLHVYTYLDIPIDGVVFTAFCGEDVKSEIKQLIVDLAERKMQTKEFTALPAYFKDNDNFYKGRVDFWWDIDNNIMFWIKDNDFEKKFKEIIPVKPEQ